MLIPLLLNGAGKLSLDYSIKKYVWLQSKPSQKVYFIKSKQSKLTLFNGLNLIKNNQVLVVIFAINFEQLFNQAIKSAKISLKFSH